MPSSWHQFHQNLVQSSSTLNFQRGFTAIKSAFPALSQFADPTALLEHLHRGTATSLQKNLVLQDLIKAAKANSRSTIPILVSPTSGPKRGWPNSIWKACR